MYKLIRANKKDHVKKTNRKHRFVFFKLFRFVSSFCRVSVFKFLIMVYNVTATVMALVELSSFSHVTHDISSLVCLYTGEMPHFRTSLCTTRGSKLEQSCIKWRATRAPCARITRSEGASVFRRKRAPALHTSRRPLEPRTRA